MTNKPETPAEWARFCAEKVMGWKRDTYHPREEINTWCTEDVLGSRPWNWSPYEYLTDAREVLEELVRQHPPEIDAVQKYKISAFKDYFEISLPWRGFWANASGPHEGPAICELAWKLKGVLA